MVGKDSSPMERIYFGGGFGLNGGTWGTSVSLSPIVGYMISSRASVGVGANYTFYKYNSGGLSFTDNRWGGMVFARMNLVRNIFAYGEYSFSNYAVNGDPNDRRMVDRLPLGLGLVQPIGGRSALNIIAAYDLLYEDMGPYANPWVFQIFFTL